ncbi:MAG TPA: terminase small subunit [Gemmataceae bacterium]|nr:terminase small subunit [Gemmataceae bacterium]
MTDEETETAAVAEPRPGRGELILTRRDTFTPKQQAFIDAYLADPNGTRAYLAAYPGVSYATAGTEARRLLKNPAIRAEIRAGRAALERAAKVKATEVVRAAARVMRADPLDLFEPGPDGEDRLRPMRRVPYSMRKAIASFKVRRVSRRRVGQGKDEVEETVEVIEVRLNDRMAAITTLMKHLGLIEKDNKPKAGGPAGDAAERLKAYGVDLERFRQSIN